MTKFKKALFVFCVGLGLSASLNNFAFALPSYETCLNYLDRCHAGDEHSCQIVDGQCGTYGLDRYS